MADTKDDFGFERGQVRTRAHLDAIDFEHVFREGTRSWRNLDQADDRFLHAVYDERRPTGFLAASNCMVRRAGLWAMAEGMLDLYASDPDKKRYFGTFAWDLGMTSEDNPVVNVTALHKTVYHVMRRLELVGFTVLELDTLRPLTGENHQRLLFHIHCVAWRERGRFRPRVAAKELMAGPAFPNSLGAPSVKFRRIRPHAADYARVGAYLSKLRPEAKNRLPHKDGEFRLRPTRKGFTGPAAVRRIEILSHLTIFETVRGVGAPGRALVLTWKRRTRANLPRPRGRGVPLIVEEMARGWAKIRRRSGSPRYAPPQIVTQASQRRLKIAERDI